MSAFRDGVRRLAEGSLALAAAPPFLLTLAFAALYTATFDSQMGSPDERQRYAVAVALARRGPAAFVGSGSVSRYPPLQSLLGAPLAKLGLALDGGVDGTWTHRLVLGLSLVACVALIPAFWSAVRSLDLETRAATAATALFGLTNPVWPYSKRFFSEPLTSALALAAFAGGLAYARRGSRAGLVVALVGLATMPLNNMVVPVAIGLGLAGLFWFEGRRRQIVWLMTAGAIGVAALAVTAKLRFGSALASGYAGDRFTFDLLDGLHGLLFGWGRSIFVFAPMLVLSLLGWRAWHRRSRGASAGVALALGFTLFAIGSWYYWWGGICWGPRLVLPVLPVASLPAAAFLADARRWKVLPIALVAAAGLYVQGIGVAFLHDYDIYFWMKQYEKDERRAWFEWEYSVIRRMPSHFRDHPWDLSSAFLRRVQVGPSTVDLRGKPVKQVRIEHRGDALLYHWSIVDLHAQVETPDGLARMPAGRLGARLETFNGLDGAGALDGNPRTRWHTNRKRLDGDAVTLVFDEERRDLARLELEHVPFEADFPNALQAWSIDARGERTEVAARAATPRLVWHPAIFWLTGLGLALLAVALRKCPPSPLSQRGPRLRGSSGTRRSSG